ncbi:MAG: hypothetical protein F4X98_15695, partial [Gammaproteobacteria bacterium]|nr:hypothetical protein [Gammaproteobacteria bacterium]
MPISGETTVTVPTRDDGRDEPDGSVTLTVLADDGYNVDPTMGSGTATVRDNGLPTITASIADATAREGNDLEFVVTLSRTSAYPVEVYYATMPIGTAQAFSDYTSASSIVTFNAGDTWKLVRIPTRSDGVSEGTEEMFVDLSGVAEVIPPASRLGQPEYRNGKIGRQRGKGTISDSAVTRPTVVSIVSRVGLQGQLGARTLEGETAQFHIVAYPAPSSPITVNIGVTEDGSWGPLTTVPTPPVTVSGSTTHFQIISTDDSTAEPSGRITATVEAGTGYVVGPQPSAYFEMWDDDNYVPTLPLRQGQQAPPQQQQQPSCTVQFPANAATVAEVTGWRDEHPGNAVHVARWNRVLVALGVDVGDPNVTPITLAESRANENVHSSHRWGRVTAALEAIAAQCPDVPAGQPELSIAAGSGITEGGTASFTITASPAPASPITVHMGVGESGDFGAVGAGTVQVSGATTTYTITTLDDTTDEPDGTVTAVLHGGDGYTVGSPSSASVAVADNDAPGTTPEVSITGGSGITEGGTATFTITASPAPTGPITVNIGVSESGSFGAAGAATVVVSGATTSYTIATTDDSADEADGSVTATLQSGQGYTVSSSQGSASVAVADNDAAATSGVSLPGTAEAPLSNGVVTVARPSGWTGSGRIQFGGGSKARDKSSFTTLQIANVNDDTFEVTWASRTAGTQQLTLEWQPMAGDTWQPSDGGAQDPRVLTIEDPSSTATPTPEVSITAGSGITEGGTASFTITASPAPADPITVNVGVSQSGDFGASGAATVQVSGATTSYTIATTDDGNDEADGSVTATLQSGNGYTVSSSNGAATVAVADNDVPEVNVTGAAGGTEGGNVTFTLTANPAPASSLPVNVTITASGDYGVSTGSRVETIPTGGSLTVTIATTDDNVDEPDGSVTLTLNGGQGYTVGSLSTETAQVLDNDEPTQQQQQQPPPTPEVSITGGSGITEGGTATFTITASPSPTSPITVNVGVSQSGDFGASGAATVVVSGATASYTISTTDDSADEADGSVTATLQSGQGYTVSSSQGAATVNVADNDVPEVSIAPGGGITEGGTATFTITASPAPAGPITVNVGVSQSGDFGASGASTVTLSGTSASYTISTTDDTADEADG